jgi:hypothetical protein
VREVAVTIILNPPGLDRVSVDPPEVYGGDTTSLAVVLTGPAPLPTPVQVSSSHPSVAPAPSEVTVPEDVHSTGAVLPTTVQTKDTVVTITARLGTVTKQAILLVKRTRLPDLIAAGTSYYESGSAVIRVSNYGEGDAAPSRLKAECYVGGNVYATEVFEVPTLPRLQTYQRLWDSPCVTADNVYGAPPYKAYADFDHQVVESNETNNNTATF